MASNEKDRLGDKLRDVEKAREDQYFAERDRKLVDEMRRQTGAAEIAGSMRCPKCGHALTHAEEHGVEVEACSNCHGMWLDHGELQRIAGEETGGWIARWLRREFEKPR